SRLRYYIDDGACILPVLRAEVARLNAEFLQRIGHRKRLVYVGVLIHVVAAIELIVDCGLTGSVDRYGYRSRLTRTRLIAECRRLKGCVRRSRNCSGNQCSKRGSIAAIEGKLDHSLLIDHLPERAGAGIDPRWIGCDRDRLFGLRYLEPEVDGQHLIDLQQQV